MGIAQDIFTLAPPERKLWLLDQSQEDQAAVFAICKKDLGTPWAFWRDDPVGFIRDVLHEYAWSKQRTIAESIVGNRRTVAPACHGPGKTHLAGRIAVWWTCVHEPGTSLFVTTAASWRQVRTQLWPHINRVADKHGFPGKRTQTEWRIDNLPVGYGFAPNKYDEAVAQGIHMEYLLVIVDEAGGIVPNLGNNLDGLMTGENSRILAIGNPPTDEEGAWFEAICRSDLWNPVVISAYDTPNFTEEREHIPPEIAKQLVDQRWVDDVERQYGKESAYYVARVLAQFPKSFSFKVVQIPWIERVMDPENMPVATSGWQRLGIDVAGGGGDEMVIAHADGNNVSIVQTWSGGDSADQVINAERCLEWIHHVENIQRVNGYTSHQVRVKVDNIGIGAGTKDVLARMGKDGKHGAEIVGVDVRERATEPDKFVSRRDEGWWTLRELIRDQQIHLTITEKTKAQIAAPTWQSRTSDGRTLVESKDSLKRRGLPSPDHADAIVLAVYEPSPPVVATSYASQLQTAVLPERVASRYD